VVAFRETKWAAQMALNHTIYGRYIGKIGHVELGIREGDTLTAYAIRRHTHGVEKLEDRRYPAGRVWRFVTLHADPKQLKLLREFLDSQVGAPFSCWTFWNWLWCYHCGGTGTMTTEAQLASMRSSHRAWTCSELTLTALLHAHLIEPSMLPCSLEPYNCTPYRLLEYFKRRGELPRPSIPPFSPGALDDSCVFLGMV
jgi:hypothetical protein